MKSNCSYSLKIVEKNILQILILTNIFGKKYINVSQHTVFFENYYCNNNYNIIKIYYAEIGDKIIFDKRNDI